MNIESSPEPSTAMRYERVERVLAKNTVRMKLFPHTRHEKISRGAARHLYRLLQQYNWSLEDLTRYQERWAAFWPSLSLIERKAVALMVMANAGGDFGKRLHVKNLPLELEAFEGQTERVVLLPAVKAELERIVGEYYGTLASPQAIEDLWRSQCPSAFGVIEPVGGIALAFRGTHLLPQEFFDNCLLALGGAGVDSAAAGKYCSALDFVLQDFLMVREIEAWR